MKTSILLLAALSMTTLQATAQANPNPTPDNDKLQTRLEAANDVVHDLMATPDKGIPARIAAKAECVAVIPGFKKGAFLVGAQYGQGVATCRTAKGWSAPVFIQMTGASFGLQAGGQSTDLVLVGMNRRSLNDLLHDKVKLGGDIAVSAGPVGRDSQAGTTALANSEFYTYSRSRGVFAGVDLTGDYVNQNAADTRAFYGKDVPFGPILKGTVPTPATASTLIQSVGQLFRRRSGSGS